MLVDLVRATAPDGATLDGALNRPDPAAAPALGLDAVALIHGTGGNFYSSTFFELLAKNFADRGVAALRANTRGHDGISTLVTAKGAVRLGAAYERVEDCRLDLAGWIAWLKQNVGPRIALLGHSLGAVKCLYALAQPGGPEVAGLIALSPPRLSYSWFCQSARAAEFLETFRWAEELQEGGQPNALMEVKLPLPFVITAAGYLEKYGPDECYDYLNFLASIRCPALFLFGGIEIEDNMAFQQAPEQVRRIVAAKPDIAVEVVPGADHFYTGVRDQAWQRMDAWLASIRA
ncbi:MAG: alpha/beta hydrolase [Gemmataceae bacterium]|nr:alpha/beta hydrolase [Gemmataceae bacterium]